MNSLLREESNIFNLIEFVTYSPTCDLVPVKGIRTPILYGKTKLSLFFLISSNFFFVNFGCTSANFSS